MVRTVPSNDDTGLPKKIAVGLLESVTSLWALCTKRASRPHKKLATNSPLSRPRQLLSTISHKAIPFRHKKKSGEELERGEGGEGYGDGGLWQRNILMGDKCQPLDFSGVIYYDNDGKPLSELPPRSPRASPLPSYVYKSAPKSKW